ncbi:NAD(P)/FAD-dependent oxidoreductase [Salinicoccus halodurans]|uniref:Oxidoreductase n=1 Tax=Salinicoccus halodurans TaxID=407035 RepID=A0A0F7HLY4_9STAP|nr:NAD(P)/FAD-dependent oxidoreductase [Salinicoccus halodurans]AKG74609.1 oxidoreductase [Salinicoccus halodurans]SFK89256.1 Thioredoxin reductase [Salinicoccus halodurans]
MYDAIIIGGGPAGLSAALNFGRGLKRTLIIDADQPRNGVTEESHGYLTQDGVSPGEFRKSAQRDALKYEDVSLERDRVTNIEKHEDRFIVSTSSAHFTSRQVLLAAGLREKGPDIKNFEQFYGTSVFYCPWCDGYELRNRRLAVMVDEDSIAHMPMLISNWSKDILICSNGKDIISEENKEILTNKGFKYNETAISEMTGSSGLVESLIFEDGTVENIEGMIVKMEWDTKFDFLENLNLKRGKKGELEVDQFGETSIPGLFTAGETKTNFAGQLINAAANGADVAKFMMMKLIQTDF